MPVLNYILWVGSSLLALLFVADFYVPAQPQRTQTPYTYNIAITSPPNPAQSAVTFSGETRDFGAPPMTVIDFAAQPNAATPAPGQQTQQARAEMTGTPTAVQSQKPARQKVAKRKINRRPADHDPAYNIPDGWRQEPTGLAFAKPFFW
jgi:hypothetical protein